MYSEFNLAKIYFKNFRSKNFSYRLPDFSKRITLENINRAVNLCFAWNNFLDVGAGSGHYAVPLLHKFAKGTAVEATFNSDLEKLKEKYHNLTINFSYVENVDFAEKFDFILLADIFEHIPLDKVDSFVKKLAKTQNPGGIIYLLTPNPVFCGPAEKSDLYYTKHKDGHYKHYTKKEICELFQKMKYELIHLSYEENPFRQWYKWLNFGLARRDAKLIKTPIIKAISWPFTFLVRLTLKFLSWLVYQNEKKNCHTDSKSISQALTFKKISDYHDDK